MATFNAYDAINNNTNLKPETIAAAKALLHVKFISKAGTYSAIIQSPAGDLIQEYKDASGANPIPDWSTNFQLLFFQCMSSRAAENSASGAVPILKEDIEYFVNGQKLSFGTDDICNGIVKSDGTVDTGSAFKTKFRRIDSNSTEKYPFPGLQIRGNLVQAFGLASGTVTMKAHISYGTQSDTIQAEYPITIRKAAGDSMRVTIEAGDEKCFTIREKGTSCLLKAQVYDQGALYSGTSGLQFQWFRMEGGQWKALSANPGLASTHQVLEVTDTMIDTYGLFMVKVTGLPTGDLVDTQSVSDLSDPYVITMDVTPDDMTIYEDGTNTEVKFTPHLVTKSGKSVSTAKFFFTVMDAAGNILNPGDANTYYNEGKVFTATREQCLQAGGDLEIVIEATTDRFLNAYDTVTEKVNVTLDLADFSKVRI